MTTQGNEILTLAFGHYSCHLAANYFNIQEASFSFNPNFSSGINHNISFRENSRRSNSCSPRLILVDDEDSLGYLSQEGYYKGKENILNEDQPDQSLIHKETGWERNEFVSDFLKEKERISSDAETCRDFLLKSSYNIDDGVVSWSDYVVAEFDEHTITTIPKYTEYYDNYDGFMSYNAGHSLWHNTDLCDEVEEKIRVFMEEADNLQGFQLLTDGGNGFSGMSSSCVELLKDEYSKKAIICIPSIYLDVTKNEDVRVRFKKKCERIYSLSSSFSSYSEYCDLVAPMSHILNPWSKEPTPRSFRHIKYKDDLMYHTSAILASALDLFTLPCRLQTGLKSMSNITKSLNIYGRCFATVGINLPFPVQMNEVAYPSLGQIGPTFFESLTPMIDVNPDRIDIQSVSTKGLGRNHMGSQMKLKSSNFEVAENEFKNYIGQLFPRTFTQLSSCKTAFRIPRTFPKVLDNNFNLQELDYAFGPLSEYISLGGLHNSREMYTVLNDLYQEAQIIKRKSIPGFHPKDTDIDHEGLFEGLKHTSETYTESSFL